MLSQKFILITLIVITLLLFGVMLASFIDTIATNGASIKTVDMTYRALENFIFLSIAGVFLFQ